MRKQISIGLAFVSFSCFGQTIEESKAFIERIVRNSPPAHYTANVIFDGSKMLFERVGQRGHQWMFAIDLAGLSVIGQTVSLSSDGKSEYYSIMMSTAPGHTCASLPWNEDEWKPAMSVELVFSDKDIANRVKKAIVHLAGLLGAKPRDEDALFR